MYLQVLFILFTCVNTIKSKETDSDEAKYIDLLPEEEKQEFLNKIAQRILAEIKGKNRSGGTSVEISDERLDEHDAYVQRIMEEETEKFKHKRRLGSQRKDDVENDDASESKVKTVEKENVLGQDDTDSSVVKNNIRIKKDTNEEVKQTSIESRRINSEGTKIPVPLLYDEEIHLSNTATVKNVFEHDESVSDLPFENHLKVEGLSKRSERSEKSESFENDHGKTDFQYKNDDNTKEVIDVHNPENIRNSYVDYDDTRTEATIDVPRTLINDFEPEEKPKKTKIISSSKGITVQSKSKTLTSGSTGNILDLSNGKFLLDVKSTKRITSTSTTPKDNKENDGPGITNDTLKMESQRSTTYAFRPILRSEVKPSEPNIKNDSMKVTEKLEDNVYKKDELRMITSSDNINKDGVEIVLTTSNIAKENSHNGYITTENIAQKDGNSKDNRSGVKKSLRYGNRDKENIEYTFTPKYPLKNPNNLAATTDNYKSHNHVFEISNQNSPFIPSEQAISELVEEPHYVPVYNYDPSNAFYTGYNYFGPNYRDNDKTSEINTNGNRVYKKLNKQNFIPDYIKNKAKKQSKNTLKNNRNFKFYDSKNGNFKPRSATYQNNLSPAWKNGFSDISFNPNDYLDLEYYLGRNDVYDSDEDNAHETSQSLFPQQLRQGKSKDVIDPDASLEHYNIKDNIAALRNALYKHKYSENPKIQDVINKNYLKARFLKWKQKFDPVLRGLDDTFFIFLPGGKGGQGRGAQDDKNIAVDYYFSRMNSEEQPLSDSNETYKPIPDKRPTTVDESKLKNTRTLDKDNVTDEKRIQFPLSPDNVLKIDVAVKDGNNVNIIFRNVKKPEPDKFEIYLNSYMNVMKDMVEHDNKGLQRYHWLGSTVDVQSAIDKLLQLTKALQAQEQLHYSDFELLKYILFVFQNSNKIIKDGEKYTQRSKNNEDEIAKSTPSGVSKTVGGDIDPTLKTLRKIYEDIKEIQEMSVTMSGTALLEFENFLLDLQTSLNKLHETIKEIATITNYKKQNWFYDLKHLYLSPVNRDVSLSLLLHLAASKLFGVIEDGARKGLEDNFIIFVQNHRAEVERTRVDFIFVLRLLEVIKKSES